MFLLVFLNGLKTTGELMEPFTFNTPKTLIDKSPILFESASIYSIDIVTPD